MEIFLMFGTIWSMHAVLAAGLTAPIIFFGRKRVWWNYWELLAFVLPFGVWVALIFLDERDKTLANIMEPIWFAPAIPTAALVRVIAGSRVRERLFAGILLAVLCAIAAGVYFFVPGLPE